MKTFDAKTFKEGWEDFVEYALNGKIPPPLNGLARVIFYSGILIAVAVLQRNKDRVPLLMQELAEFENEISSFNKFEESLDKFRKEFEDEFTMEVYSAAREMMKNNPDMKKAELRLLVGEIERETTIEHTMVLSHQMTPPDLGTISGVALGNLMQEYPSLLQQEGVKAFIEKFTEAMNSSNLKGSVTATIEERWLPSQKKEEVH